MVTDVSPKKVQQYVQLGRKRLANFRQARLMFLRQYVGQYYDTDHGSVGTEPLNLIFNAIRILVPNLVINYPKHSAETQFLQSRQYGDLLALALDYLGVTLNIKDLYRRWLVDAIFTLGTVKTGLAESDSVYTFDEDNKTDAGTVFSELVDFDNLIVDPKSREHLFADAAFVGDVICVPRAKLLDSGLYANDLVERLPRAGDYGAKDDGASRLSMSQVQHGEEYELNDEVEIAELWVPSAKAVLTVPACEDLHFDEYLRVHDYYGPNEGPYTFLALTPPVPGNPLPVALVGIWQDLHVRANRMAVKVMDQAERQKDIIGYKRAAQDDAEALRDAGDGEAISVDDHEAIKIHSFGGQQNSNESHLAQLQGWFNQMAANPQSIGGQTLNSDSATEARILQSNASVGLEDMRDLLYQAAGQEARKRAWYLHTDPFIKIPLVRRDQVAAQYAMTPAGPVQTQSAQVVDQQVILTPEARRGDFLDFTFKIQVESMSRVDSRQRLATALDFAVKILPASAQAAQTMMMMGIPFNVKSFILRMAKEAGMSWMDEVFFDPEFQMRMMQMMMMGPGPQTSQGQPGGQGPGGQSNAGLAAVLQNQQPGQVMGGMPSSQTQDNQQAQLGANQAQRETVGGGY